MSEFVEVYAANDITLAYLIKAHLDDAGIPVQIANENVSAAYCLDGMVPRVLVPAECADQARRIIDEIHQSPEDEVDGFLEDTGQFDDEAVDP